MKYPTVDGVLAATKKLKAPESSDIRDAWKVIDSLLSPGKFNEGYKEWKAETKPLFDEAVKHGKLSLWPMDKAAREIRINDYKRRVELEAIDNPVIVAKLPPGATYYEMLDGSHRLITRAEAGYSDVPVFLIELPDEFSDLMAMEGDTLEDLGKYPTVKSVLAEYEDDIPSGEKKDIGGISRHVINFFRSWDFWGNEKSDQYSKYPEVEAFLSKYRPKESITLYRGLKYEPENLEHFLRFSGLKEIKKGPTQYTDKRLSSWTYALDVIRSGDFAADDVATQGVILRATIEPKDVLVDFTLIPQDLADLLSLRGEEQEVIVKPGKFPVEIIEVTRYPTVSAVLAGTIQYKKYVDEDGYLVVEAFDGSKRVGQLECKESQAEPGKLFPSGVKVDPAYRRQGIATRMYEMAVEETGLEFKDQLGRSPEGQAFRKAWDKKRAKSSAGRAIRADADKLLALLRPALGNKADVKLVGSLTRKNKAKDIDILLIMRPENLTDQEMGNASTPGGEPMNDEPFWWPLFEKIGMELYECNGIWDDPETGEQHSMETWDWEGLVVDVFGDWGELG